MCTWVRTTLREDGGSARHSAVPPIGEQGNGDDNDDGGDGSLVAEVKLPNRASSALMYMAHNNG